MDWFPVFRTGTHTDSAGNEKTWTEADLDRMVHSYDPSAHEAPIVIGHPQDNAPAYGWVEALKREGSLLLAKPKDLVPEFVEMVRRTLFKKRSISVYPDGSLRHVGFLGAMPPAVKGLPDVSFEDAEASVWEYADPSTAQNPKEDRKMKFVEWLRSLASKEGVTIDDLPRSFSESDIQARIDQARKEEREKAATEFSEAGKTRERALKDREDALSLREAESRKNGIAAFCEGLLKEGRLTPGMMKHGMGVKPFLEALTGIETTFDFAEGGDGKKQTPLEFMESFLAALPKSIEFGEVATRDKDIGRGSAAAGVKLEALIKEKMKTSPALTYGAAFAEVQKEHPELATEYASDYVGKEE
jgi:hypothetical protein